MTDDDRAAILTFVTKRRVPAETSSSGAELIAYAVSWIVGVGGIVLAVVPLLAIIFATFTAVKAARRDGRRLPDSSTAPQSAGRLGWRS
jgi:hypothetical protein